ncbi:sensor histidine kinase [Amycolatopsis anabasis]|uniref:sensor histidine kinase n=1 Tax=Amycolatopsis anabasis TaxID=1840409 RepID=UPI00131BD952|nr:ATP-binding protein [Amycolatopsis anabasis]
MELVANPLGIVAELRGQARAHASLVLEAFARAIGSPGSEPHPGEPLAEPAVLGGLWACRRARFTDALKAIEILAGIALEEFADLVSGLPGEPRAALVTRAARLLQELSSRHLSAAADSYDAYLLEQVEQANSDDRKRLARDVHDQLGNSLVLAMRHLELYRVKARGAGDDHLRAVEGALAEAKDFTRLLFSGLRAKAPLTSLARSLTACAEELNFRAAEVRVRVHGDEAWLPENHRDEIFLILREFLRNSFAHASPENVRVRVGISPGRVDVAADDDGSGFASPDRNDLRDGAGLTVMRERAEHLGGRLSLISKPGRGTSMRLWVPLPENEHRAD